MGGRGASSGGRAGDDYLDMLDSIRSGELDDVDTIQAQAMMLGHASKTPTPIRGLGMPEPELMVNIEFDNMHVAYPEDSPTAAASIAAMIRARAIMPDKVNTQTRMVILADAVATMGPQAIAVCDKQMRSVVAFKGDGISLTTYIHESMHLYLASVPGGVDAVTDGAFQDAIDSGEPTPYPQGHGDIEEDFVESFGLYVTAPDQFRETFPQRAAVLDVFIMAN